MDKQTLSNYGWIVVCILVLCVMIALATPFGSFIASGIKSTAQGLFDVNQKAFNNVGFGQIPDQSFEDSYNGNGTSGAGGSGDGYDHDAPELHPNDGTGVYDGMIVRYGNYEYCYGYVWCIFECDDHEGANDKDEWSMTCNCKDKCDGWGVKCINNTADPGPIMESINGKPIVDMTGTFKNFDKLVVSPVIPETVEGMGATFYLCTSLVAAPYIPDSVNCVDDMFCCCTSLKTAVNIPKSASRLYSMFYGCINLEVAPIIPESEEGAGDIAGLFSGCTSLKTYAGSIDPDGDFSGYVIPSSVTNMYDTFNGCTSLTTAPIIPSSVTDMSYTFYDCTSLTGTITINTTPTGYAQCFQSTQITEILGSCGNKSELLATK